MTAEGRLARGKENYEAGKLLDNQETIDYAATISKEEPKAEKPKKAKEAKDDKSDE